MLRDSELVKRLQIRADRALMDGDFDLADTLNAAAYRVSVDYYDQQIAIGRAAQAKKNELADRSGES